jgi:hypothetical protein
MMTSHIHNGKTSSLRRKLAIGFVIIVVSLSGCSKASQKAGDLGNSIGENKNEEQQETQDIGSPKTDGVVKKDEPILEKPLSKPAAASAKDRAVKKDDLILEKPVLKPAVASAGGTVHQELKYSLFSVKKGKLKITEVIVLSGKGLKLELSKKVLERMPGDHVSTFQFTLPRDLPSGDYQLITSVSFGKERKNKTVRFRVKR